MNASPATVGLPAEPVTVVAGRQRSRARPAPAVMVGTGVVVAAIDDDGNAAQVITYARSRAIQLWVPLRVAHVWMSRRERLSHADLLLSAVLHDFDPDQEQPAERQILHDADPAHALAALSRQCALLVVALNSDPTATDVLPGHTTRQLIGHTGCPLAVVPATRHSATSARW